MKKLLLTLTAIIAFGFITKAQILTTAIASGNTISCNGGNANKSALAFNPDEQMYYSNNAGGTKPNEYYDINGTYIGNSLHTDWRGMWYSSTTQALEGNTWSGVCVIDTLTSAGVYTQVYSMGFISNPPNPQSAGVYDYDDNVIFYYDSDSLYSISRVDGSALPTIELTGISNFSNVRLYSLIYTGLAQNEIGLYSNADKELYLFDKSTGALSNTVSMPALTPSVSGNWGISYTNELFWIYTSSGNKWLGYQIDGACIVNIPDTNFKTYLVGNAAINTNGNTEIECAEANAFTGGIYCNSQNITVLTGIEAFTSLKFLRCAANSLISLDVSNNIALEDLWCFGNSITSLDVSSNTALKDLRCGSNQLTTLDVSNNIALEDLVCSGNQLSVLNVSSNVNLEMLQVNVNQLTNLDITNNLNLLNLHCGENLLSSIDVTNNTGLEYFYCSDNTLTSLDVSNNTNLIQLGCESNNISSLDVSNNVNMTRLECQANTLTNLDVSSNTILEDLYCHTNFLTSLDVSNNSNLDYLQCQNNAINSLDVSANANLNTLFCNDNALTSLDVANGNNTNFVYFYAENNPNLSCINVDDANYSTTNWTNIDATASFSETCIVLVNAITVQGQGGVSSIITNGGTLQMSADVLPTNADDATYTWSVNNANASISATGILTALANGTVEVTATANDASGTVGTKTITISNQSVGINDMAFENLNIFPNPTNGIINLDIFEKLTNIKIMDLTGKTIKVFNSEAKQLDISAFTTGIYFLEIANAEKKSIIKLLKK